MLGRPLASLATQDKVVKTSQDPRHEKRIGTVHKLFAYSFDVTQSQGLEDILTHLDQIDAKIAAVASERPLYEISKVDLAILRLAVFELLYGKESKAVVIDEAIEIAKSYSSDSSPKFVNAVLGKIAGTL